MNLKKKAILFALEDVLIPGNVDKKVSREKVEQILGNLSDMEEKGLVRLFLITGLDKKVAVKKIQKYGLKKYFKKENIFYVTKEYISQKDKIDKKRYFDSLKEDPEFNDDYFKQYIINKIIDEGRIPKEEMLFVGHDLITDGFYTIRFSGIDFALLKESLSERNEKAKHKIKGLVYIKREWKDVRKALYAKLPEPDYRILDNHVFEQMKQRLFEGTELQPFIGRRA